MLKKAESVVNRLVLWTWLLSSLPRMTIPYSVTLPYQSLASLPKTCLLLNYIGFPWLQRSPQAYSPGGHQKLGLHLASCTNVSL